MSGEDRAAVGGGEQTLELGPERGILAGGRREELAPARGVALDGLSEKLRQPLRVHHAPSSAPSGASWGHEPCAA